MFPYRLPVLARHLTEKRWEEKLPSVPLPSDRCRLARLELPLTEDPSVLQPAAHPPVHPVLSAPGRPVVLRMEGRPEAYLRGLLPWGLEPAGRFLPVRVPEPCPRDRP